jgi:hypothetical protein
MLVQIVTSNPHNIISHGIIQRSLHDNRHYWVAAVRIINTAYANGFILMSKHALVWSRLAVFNLPRNIRYHD